MIKDEINKKEMTSLFVFRLLQLSMFAVLAVCELIGVKPETCNSLVQKIGSIVLLVLVATAIIVAYLKLKNALRDKFNDAYRSHGRNLLYFCVGISISLLAYTTLVFVPLF